MILAHAMIKEHKQVPEKEIELALKYKNLWLFQTKYDKLVGEIPI